MSEKKILLNKLSKIHFILGFFFIVTFICCSNLFSDFVVDSELCYDSNQMIFHHTYKNGSFDIYKVTYIGKRIDKMDTTLINEIYEIVNDTLIINLALKEPQSRYFSIYYHFKDSTYDANIRNVSRVYSLSPFSNYTEFFRIKEFAGLSFEEITDKIKYIKVIYAIKLEKQYYRDSVIKLFNIEKCCD
ncbi:hypothetical protein ACFLSQ_06675 [Bacteroidota bacterium]